MMEAMRKAWTGERLDDMSRRMEAGFARIDADIRELRTEMGAMQRTMAHGFIAFSAVMVAGFGGMAGLIATQI